MTISYVILLVGLSLAAVLLGILVRLLRADKLEGEKSAARVTSLKGALKGQAVTRGDWMPDARVKGGMVYNRKENRIEITGRLSEDSLDRVFP